MRAPTGDRPEPIVSTPLLAWGSGAVNLVGRAIDRVGAALPLEALERLGRRSIVGPLSVGALAVLASALVAALGGVPEPSIHDEFAYVLQGDTFAQGRLANPTPPAWHHFETFHVLMTPSYASKYPPGQGLVLAVGFLLGHPILGVWLSVGFMVAAITWMLLAWVGPRWGILGGLLAVFQIGAFDYWAHSYWGGAVAATGGALLFGAVRRLGERPRTISGVALGVGIVILALTRPLEGLVATVAAGGVLTWALVRLRPRLPAVLGAAAACGAVVLAGAAFMGLYNEAVTGNPTVLPYREYSRQYSMNRPFLWQSQEPRSTYRHPRIEEYRRVWGIVRRESKQDAIVADLTNKLRRHARFYAGFALLALVGLPRVLRDPWMRAAAATGLVVAAASLLTLASHPHYLAPATGLVLLLAVASLRSIESRPVGSLLGRRWIAFVFALVAVDAATRETMFRVPMFVDFANTRAEFEDVLERERERDLVLVDYASDYPFLLEWVYNRADIRSADVVWARSLASNDDLLQAFPNHRVWRLRLEPSGARLSPIRDPIGTGP